MPIINFNITKAEVEKKKLEKVPEGPVSFTQTPNIVSIKEIQMSGPGGRLNVLDVEFNFLSNYDPDVGAASIRGNVYYQEGEEFRKKILEQWEGKKPLDTAFFDEVINGINSKCYVFSMMLIKELGLPIATPFRYSASPDAAKAEKPKKK
ncbi:MAG: hypothetical protein APG12_01026 [Candidatus Methanofastidiosum methylothiophilum]|uniref:Uncharacterized protein n=1 Tax=Candidatus Methanofastidiosum methylothiophilum TaxID=1705564 RepID=A0A150IS36_9EURY|nr:MAG: hypothetical protein APG10_00804 [Candidatus Methanofastidiosum methylthiophilus]KYC47655.1 MAG: hypothetical protein APG11_00976 [Candidatus Methanofastidiosum methylthiophilus]KYC50116.1 MAG: hypothetical protein APG12_01026 [Candidatus Methanofastidiosum methylthiophilus]